MPKETATPNPCTDIQSVSIECQIDTLLSSALAVCDISIHYNQPTKREEFEAILWRIRILVESAQARFDYGLEVQAFAA
jgi:hypothetical protein